MLLREVFSRGVCLHLLVGSSREQVFFFHLRHRQPGMVRKANEWYEVALCLSAI
jgi:hypothetical protein